MSALTEVSLELKGMRLTERQRAFVINYRGIPEDACEAAGYQRNNGSHSHTIKRLMDNPLIIHAIKRRDEIMDAMPNSSDPIMTVEELRQWWTQNIVNGDNSLSDRITCSKLLAQSYGAFIERVIVDEKRDIQVEFRFAGPKSNFLKDRERQVIDITPQPVPALEELL